MSILTNILNKTRQPNTYSAIYDQQLISKPPFLTPALKILYIFIRRIRDLNAAQILQLRGQHITLTQYNLKVKEASIQQEEHQYDVCTCLPTLTSMSISLL